MPEKKVELIERERADKIGKLIGQGNTAEIYEWNTDKVLKLYRNGIPDMFCKNEFNSTKMINESLGIGPKAINIIEVQGRVGAIYEKIIGKTMLKEMLSKVWNFKKQSRLLANYHISIQKFVDFELPTVKEKLKQDIENVNELTNTEKKYLFEYIDNLSNGKTLCHFDFHPDNIIIRNEKPVIIDWMTACIGDPLADVARTSIILKYSEVPMKSKLVNKLIRGKKIKLYEDYITEYMRVTKCKIEDIQKWELPIAAARLREWVPQNEKKTLLNIVHEYISKEKTNLQ